MNIFFKKLLSVLLVIILALSVCGCNPTDIIDTPASSEPSSPLYTSDEIGLYVKKDEGQAARVVDKTGADAATYTLDTEGNIVKDGTKVVPADKTEQFIAAHTMLLSDTTLNFTVGETFSAEVFFFPEGVSCTEYTVSVVEGDETSVTDGKVVFSGTGEVTCKVTSVTNPTLSDTCTVTVYPENELPADTAADYKEYGNTPFASVLGMDTEIYMNWLKSHENDDYYLTTPYIGGDYRSPKGDISYNGFEGMNCTGFVWHVLWTATKESSGKHTLVPGMSGWVKFYKNNDIKRYRFETKDDMLASGKLSKGDIIWIFDSNGEAGRSGTHHIGIYWGNGSSDIWWHSLNGIQVGMAADANMISHIGSLVDPYYYIVLDVA